MDNTTIQKIYLSDQNTALFECPKCHISKDSDVSKYKDLEISIKLKVKCRCGNVYEVILERRKQFRKETHLPGKFSYASLTGEEQNGIMTILDLSKGGLRFKMLSEPRFQKNEIIEVEFNLDNSSRTFIQKQVFVRNIKGVIVNVKFCSFDPNDSGDKAIAFYLF
ncbi:MAG: PilZ domain-containing protein [Deltaproteobacteria bacterium]|jgi:hypothetical protein|nr:PilZ domain-containing protein [Deltaproteobacteria bacterium]